jgi:hypothetical protein
MSSVVISGDTSGAITLAAPAVAGTNTLTLPASTGTILTTATTGQCKAWVNFTGSTGAIQASYNVSSVTVNSTGNYTINFTTAMPSANYVTLGTCSQDNLNNTWNSFGVQLYTYPTASATRILTGYYSAVAIALNPVTVCVAVFSA